MNLKEIKRVLKSFAFVEVGHTVTIFKFDKVAFEQAIEAIEELEELKANVKKLKKVLEIRPILESIEEDEADAAEKLKKIKEIIEEKPFFISDGKYQAGWNDGIMTLQEKIKGVLDATNNEEE